MAITISTSTGDIELTGHDETDFLASLPGEIETPESTSVSTQQSKLQLIAMGLNDEQVDAFFAAASKL